MNNEPIRRMSFLRKRAVDTGFMEQMGGAMVLHRKPVHLFVAQFIDSPVMNLPPLERALVVVFSAAIC